MPHGRSDAAKREALTWVPWRTFATAQRTASGRLQQRDAKTTEGVGETCVSPTPSVVFKPASRSRERVKRSDISAPPACMTRSRNRVTVQDREAALGLLLLPALRLLCGFLRGGFHLRFTLLRHCCPPGCDERWRHQVRAIANRQHCTAITTAQR